MHNDSFKSIDRQNKDGREDPLGPPDQITSQNIPDGVDRRTFLMRSSLIGATTVITGHPVSAQQRADRSIGTPPTPQLSPDLAVVTQETVLFNDTIRNNIALGRPGAANGEVETAARHAFAHEFILEKPKGYDTIIGEKGVMLSGGQRQRLAIARAILKNAPILVLDEATSSLDTESERAVQAALEQLMIGRTTICIAHRLSTIQRADRIVVLDQGRIVETGNHSDLIKRGGIYQKLYQMQFP